MTAREPTVQFDHHAQAFAQQGAVELAEFRGRCPVAYTASNQGYWVASSYEAARRVLSDDEHFTVERSADGTRGGLLIPSAPHAPRMWPGELDGSEHARLRRPLKTAFSRGYLEENVAPRLERSVHRILDELAEKESFDFVTDFSFALTVESIFDYVGLDEVGDRAEFIRMLEDAFAIDPEAGGEREQLAEETSPRFQRASELTRAAIRKRRQAPTSDLIGLMVSAQPALSEDEIVSLTLSLVLGGVRTTASAIDNTAWYLECHHDLRTHLIEHPGAIPAALDELLRLYSPTPFVARTVVEGTEVGGVALPEGDRVAAAICSANLDPGRFPDPEHVDLDRRDGLHLAFGVGTHYCLGIWLAKLELRVAITALLDRMPGYRIDLDRAQRYEHVGVNNGWATLPAVASA
jgi:cytochrome P450